MYKILNAEQVLAYLIRIIENGLTELSEAEPTEFVIGEWYAYVECLEIICCWQKAKEYGLDYNPELKYALAKK